MAKINNIRTSKTIASKASKALKSGSTSKNTKTLAAEALVNRKRETR